jgi:hypothetical protein
MGSASLGVWIQHATQRLPGGHGWPVNESTNNVVTGQMLSAQN